MKVKITCPKCGSTDISIISNPEGTSPLYQCRKCGHKSHLFPQFGKKDETGDDETDDEKIEEKEEIEEDEEVEE